MREDLIKILANIGNDYAGTVDKLEEYIYEKGKSCYWQGAKRKDISEWVREKIHILEYFERKQTTNK